MDILKKTILLATISGTTTGCTHCHVIIPDLTAKYNFKISLTQNIIDCGFFDVYDYDDLIGATVDNITYTVTGECKSRLSELKKYTQTNSFTNKYINNGSTTNNGVNYNNSVENSKIEYYIDSIKYLDKIINNVTTTTTFSFIRNSISNVAIDFVNKPIVKDETKGKIISYPKIDDDVFIIRQELSAFENNYRLEFIENLADLESYVGGKYFNIVNNS